MRSSRILDEGIAKYVEDWPIWRCQQCGLCSGICPSEKAGGIRPIEIIMRTSSGTLDLQRDVSLWLCAMCNSCSERCQMGVDPSEIICSLRGEAARRGNLPRHISEEAKLFVRTGLSFPNSGMTKKLRKDLGLEELAVPPKTCDDLGIIVMRTGLGVLKLE